jgi:putative Holliday junction resolvase
MALSSASPGGCVLAFDFGTRRIGVAVGDTTVRLAHPLATIAADREQPRLRSIEALVAEWRPAFFVVGLPTHADGLPHAMTERARRFARELERRFGLPVELSDERFTTQGAVDALREAGARGRERKAARDSVAAQLILQDYLDRRRPA